MRQAEHSNSQNSNETSIRFDQSQKIKDVLSFVQSKYVDTIDSEIATDLALDALLSNLDPYSEYIPSQYMHKYADQIQGKIRGIGIDLVEIDSQLVVSQVRSQSPAAIAGISVGNYMLEIENHAVIPFLTNPDSIEYFIENYESDSILLKWKNHIQNQIQKEKIAIAELDEHPVTDVHIPIKEVLYFKLNQLSKDSYREFMKTVERYFESGQCKHLIIDLRGNTGGLIHEAAYILNQLISDKDVLMFKTSGIKTKSKEYKSTGKPFFNIEKIIVLVNQETASAAELMAAALQDLDRAIIIGTPTFGKSTVLEQFSLGDGSAIRLAVSRFYTYSGRSIQKNYKNSDEDYFLGQSGQKMDSIFYSLKKKKIVSRQGVIPDFVIPINQMKNAAQDSLRELADYIIGKNFFHFNSLIKNNPDNINTNEKLTQFIKSEIIIKTNSKGSSELEEECKYALASWFFSNELEQRMRLLNDECLERAIKVLRN